jgi:hypothetical protein
MVKEKMLGGYVINVGRERAEEVIVAHVDKKGNPKGSDHMKRHIAVGKHLVANVCSVWGRRVINGDVLRDEQGNELAVEFNTPKYSGEIEFLKYGDPRGYLITIRYLKRSRSLDVEYQDGIQKIKIDYEKGDDGSAQIALESGENKFDYKSDALFIQYLKVHPQNRESISKNPEPAIKGFSFYEVRDEDVNTKTIERGESILDAGYIVKGISNKPDDLFALLAIVNMVGKREDVEADTLSKPKQVYEALLKFAMNKPTDFISLVETWKRKISDAFEKAKSFKALDLTKNGHIALIIENKPLLIWSGLKSKNEGMVDEVLEKYSDSDNFKKLNIFIDSVEKLK